MDTERAEKLWLAIRDIDDYNETINAIAQELDARHEREDDLDNDLRELLHYCGRHRKLPKDNTYTGGKSAAYEHVFSWLSRILDAPKPNGAIAES